MWIRGYKLKPGVIPPYVICDEIKRLGRILAYEHGAKFSCSISSEACYLEINDMVISLRNHPGRPTDLDIYLARFRSWDDCVAYFNKVVWKIKKESFNK
jgi:hypothetical protein